MTEIVGQPAIPDPHGSKTEHLRYQPVPETCVGRVARQGVVEESAGAEG